MLHRRFQGLAIHNGTASSPVRPMGCFSPRHGLQGCRAHPSCGEFPMVCWETFVKRSAPSPGRYPTCERRKGRVPRTQVPPVFTRCDFSRHGNTTGVGTPSRVGTACSCRNCMPALYCCWSSMYLVVGDFSACSLSLDRRLRDSRMLGVRPAQSKQPYVSLSISGSASSLIERCGLV